MPFVGNLDYAMQASGAKSGEGSSGIFENSSLFTGFLNIFRFFGPWTFWAKLLEDSYFPWVEKYDSFFFVTLSFVGPFLAITALFLNKTKKIYFFALLYILGLFLMKGAHFPFEGVNKFLVLKIPFMAAFRNSYEKFGLIALLGYSILLGRGMDCLYNLGKKYIGRKISRLLLFMLCFLLFGVYMWPYWTGDLIYQKSENKPGARVRIPKYYLEAKDWLRQDNEDFRLLSLPHQEGAAYNWDYGYVGSDDPATQVLERSLVAPINPLNNNLSYLDYLFASFLNNDPASQIAQARLSGWSNNKYLMLHHDLASKLNTPSILKSKDIKAGLDTSQYFSFVRSFGQLDFYKLENYYLPHIFAGERIFCFEGDAGALARAAGLKEIPQKSIFLENCSDEIKSKSDMIYYQTALSDNFDKIGRYGQVMQPVLEKSPMILKNKNSLDIDNIVENKQLENFDPNKQNFILEVPEGKYSFLVGEKEETQLLPDWRLTMDGKTMSADQFKFDSGWYIWPEELYFNGNKELSIEFSNNNNLLDNNWQSYEDDRFGKVYFQPIDGWENKAFYSLGTEIDQGESNFSLYLGEAAGEKPDIDNINNYFAMEYREAEKSANNFLLYSKLDKKAAYVFLLSNDINFTPARVKKLSLIRIWRPDILLWQKKTKSWSEPIITVNTKSSSKYKLSVEGVSSDYILYFAESYFPGWELTLHLADGSKIKLDESRHIKANSFANAWFIKAQDSRGESNYNIDIEFSQQGLILKGALISLLGLGLVVLFYLRIKK